MISTLPIYVEVLLLVFLSALVTLFVGGLFAANPDCEQENKEKGKK